TGALGRPFASAVVVLVAPGGPVVHAGARSEQRRRHRTAPLRSSRPGSRGRGQRRAPPPSAPGPPRHGSARQRPRQTGDRSGSGGSNSNGGIGQTPATLTVPRLQGPGPSVGSGRGATRVRAPRVSVREALKPYTNNPDDLFAPPKADRPWKYVVLHHSASDS